MTTIHHADLVYCHAHVKEGWTGQSSDATDVVLNAGFSRLRFSRRPPGRAVACVGFDQALDPEFIRCPESENKIAVLWEPRPINLEGFDFAGSRIAQISHIFSHDQRFLAENPNKASFFVTGGSYIKPHETLSAWPKTRLVSIAASKKRFLPGHHLRHEVIQGIPAGRLVTMGSGYRPYRSSSTPYKNFFYSIVIENVQEDQFFTEKLIHSLLYRCIPLYWGAHSLPRGIDERGIIRFDSVSQLRKILKGLSVSAYRGLREIVKHNQAAALEYASSELNLQRVIGPLLGLDGFEKDRAIDYFPQAKKLLSGRARFNPELRASF